MRVILEEGEEERRRLSDAALESVVVFCASGILIWRHKCTEAMEMTKDDREKKKKKSILLLCVCLRNWYLGGGL